MANLFEQKYPNNIRVVSGTVTPKQDDVVLLCDTSTAAVVINLLDIPANHWSTQWKLYIIDNANNASVNNITINAPSGKTINGASSVTITHNKASFSVVVSSNTNYVAQYSVISAAGGYTTVEDEGVALPQRSTMNFVGAGVTVTDAGGKTVVTINNSGGIYWTGTFAELQVLVAANSIVAGAFYYVTDVQLTQLGAVFQGANSNTLSNNGWGIFLNADYESNGVYTGMALPFGTQKSMWNSQLRTVNVGDVIIYNNEHYQSLTGVWWNGAPDGNPSTDSINWQKYDRINLTALTYGYILEVDEVRWNQYGNYIIYRADARQNEIHFASTAANPIYTFQWGRNNAYGNVIKGKSTFDATNSWTKFKFNLIDSGNYSSSTSWGELNRGFQYNKIWGEGTVYFDDCRGKVEENEWYGIKVVTRVSSMEYGCSFSRNKCQFANIQINSMIASSELESNCFNSASDLYIGEMRQSSFKNNVLNSCTTSIDIMDLLSGFESCVCDNLEIKYSTLIPSQSPIRKKYSTEYSNFVLNLDLSDPAIYDAGTETLTIPFPSKHYGIFNLNNASGQIISKIVCPDANVISFPIKFYPSYGGTLQFKHTLIASAVAGNLCCDAPSSVNTITGRADGTDFIEYRYSGGILIRTNLVLLA